MLKLICLKRIPDWARHNEHFGEQSYVTMAT